MFKAYEYIVKNTNKNRRIVLNRLQTKIRKNMNHQKTCIDIKPCHNISQLLWLSVKCEIYCCSIFIRFLFVLFIHKARLSLRQKTTVPPYLIFVSAFVLVVLGRINNALSRVGSRDGTGQRE